MKTSSIKNYWYKQTFIKEGPSKGLSPLNRCVFIMVLTGVLISALDTEPSLNESFGLYFRVAELGIASFFFCEYLLRIWSITENDKYKGYAGRLRYALSPLALIDLLAFLPSLLTAQPFS